MNVKTTVLCILAASAFPLLFLFNSVQVDPIAFLGAIIGGIISGLITLAGVQKTIEYSDATRLKQDIPGRIHKLEKAIIHLNESINALIELAKYSDINYDDKISTIKKGYSYLDNYLVFHSLKDGKLVQNKKFQIYIGDTFKKLSDEMPYTDPISYKMYYATPNILGQIYSKHLDNPIKEITIFQNDFEKEMNDPFWMVYTLTEDEKVAYTKILHSVMEKEKEYSIEMISVLDNLLFNLRINLLSLVDKLE